MEEIGLKPYVYRVSKLHIITVYVLHGWTHVVFPNGKEYNTSVSIKV